MEFIVNNFRLSMLYCSTRHCSSRLYFAPLFFPPLFRTTVLPAIYNISQHFASTISLQLQQQQQQQSNPTSPARNHDDDGNPSATASHNRNSNRFCTILHQHCQCIFIKRNWWRLSSAAMAATSTTTTTRCTVTVVRGVVKINEHHATKRRRWIRHDEAHGSEGQLQRKLFLSIQKGHRKENDEEESTS